MNWIWGKGAFLASQKLAIILLVLLLVGLSVGTIVETRSGVEAAGGRSS